MAEYRRELTLDTDKQYWYVDMGVVLDRLNGPGRYPFPTEPAALRFARNHKRISPDRSVAVLFPDGRRLDIEQE